MAMHTTPISPRDPSAVASPRRWRDVLLLPGLVLLVVAGLAGLAWSTGWQETLDALNSISFAALGALLVLSLVNYIFRGLRWHVFAQKLGLATSLSQNMRHFLAGFAMTVTPGRIGELIRMRWLKRETGWSFERTAPLVLIDRAADLAAMAILLILALTFSTTGVTGGIPVAIVALIGSILITRPQLMRLIAGAGHALTSKRFPHLFARIRRAAVSLGRFSDPNTLSIAGFLGVIGWIAECYAFYLVLMWMGADTGFWLATGIFIFSTIAGGLTGAPGGVGGAEAAMIALLVLYEVPLTIAAPATLVIRVTTLWFAILIGILIFPLAERLSHKATHVEI